MANDVTWDLVARDKFSRTYNEAGQKTKGLGSSLKALIPIAAGLAAVNVFKGFIEDAAESAKISRITANVIKSTGGAANVSAAQIDKLAQSLSNKTAVDDELVQTGANLLLTFKNIRNEAGKGNDIFNQATAAALDLSAAGFGSVESASKMLGKALNDPLKGLTALGRAGVTFTAQQKKQITTLVEAGDTLGAQRIIMEEIASQVGGAAAAAADPMEKLRTIVGNLGERVGTALLPIIQKIASWLGKALPKALDFASTAFGALIAAFREGDVTSDGFIGVMERIGVIIRTVVNGVQALIAAFREGDVTSDGFVGVMERIGVAARAVFDFMKNTAIPTLRDIGGFFARNTGLLKALAAAVGAVVVVTKLHAAAMAVQAAGGIVAFLGNYLKGIKLVQIATKAWAAMQWLLNVALTANPIGLVIAAVAALAVGLVMLWKKSETFRNIVKGAFNVVWTAIKAVWNWTKTNWPLLLAILLGPIGLAITAIIKNWEKVRAAIGAAWNWLKVNVFQRMNEAGARWSERFAAVKDAIGNIWTRIKIAAKAAWRWLDKNVFSLLKTALDGIKAAWAGIKAGFEAGVKSVPGLGALFGGGGKGGRQSAFDTGPGGRVFPLPAGTYSWGMGPAGHGYDAQDLPTPTGNLVRAPVSGFARGIDLGDRSYGKYVQIASSRFGRVILAHLSRLFIGSGFVSAGQLVGLSGSTGKSTGPHLHVEPSGILSFAKGGIIPEHVVGVGMRSGRPYQFGEGGPETVTPGRGGPGSLTVNVYTGVGDPKAIGREVVQTVGAYIKAGGRLPPRWHTA